MADTFTFEIAHLGEPGAGLHAYYDTVWVSVASGHAGGDPAGNEFSEYVLGWLKEWFDGADVRYLPDQDGAPNHLMATAWLPGGSGSYKRCPRCGSGELEGMIECSQCGAAPEDDVTWRRMVRRWSGDGEEG